MGVQLLAIQLFAFVFEDQNRVELIRANVIEGEVDAQLQRCPEIQGAPDEQASFRGLRRIELVERAVITPGAIVWGIRAQAWVAEFVAAQGPVHQKSQGRLLGPRAAYEFGSPGS
jgi:hypothetical protein